MGTSSKRSKLTRFFPTQLRIHRITPSDTVRNLGVTFDSDFNFRKHVSLTCCCCFYRIRGIRCIRRYIYLSVAQTIATSFVTSRLDYRSSLIYNFVNTSVHQVFTCCLLLRLKHMLVIVISLLLSLLPETLSQ